jgi:hypothetical protein
LEPENAVSLVIVTHWDDDHIQGSSQVVAECSNAAVAVSAALRRTELVQFVMQETRAGRSSGTDELRDILRLATPHRLIWARDGLQLFPRPQRVGSAITALAPSDDVITRGYFDIAEALERSERIVGGRYRAPEGPNGGSVAAFARNGEVGILLGADLEATNNPNSGWTAAIARAKPEIAASILKVPHHGSADAHDEAVWDQLLEPEAIALIAPFWRGNVRLPTKSDLLRIHARTNRVFVTAKPELVPAKLDRETEKALKRTGARDIKTYRGWGQVRARFKLDGEGWAVELIGDAYEFTSPTALGSPASA